MKGILFKADILKDKLNALTQYGEAVTRRVIKPQPAFIDGIWDYRTGKKYGMVGLSSNLESAFRESLIEYAPYQPGEGVYLKEAWCESYCGEPICYKLDGKESPGPKGFWRSPMILKAVNARHFLKVTGVRAERLSLPLSPEELKLEGGEPALEYLKDYEGKWLWRIVLTLKKKE